MKVFTPADADWDRPLAPGETPAAKVLCGIFASVALCLEESGCPLNERQVAALRAALGESA